ncbi:hypothetical protein I4I73_07645 [Pseudonocardia sp. KRD-184]|uniref:Parallel beta helix pectate lyase-like protein n=1 Tax=Pseudonocardia oceani TaxID=2792013 RepID=A0ABS6U666_9PSEU|nr:hypothetical protein [Pseudonocardia oceani]MBW0088903.1 hypothetical protein [Pseudonocardia oceani]MBW0095868.1 hypothetical protein [Pseudonocardia oceani]MBW0108667.1 hypothetical protein [Pseudonocardia oceani]MBW0122603.1 hypothetical protein [Pseudonocardia oceani]MBW0127713.1 hypothetical protein [Pseudonocardia oceani]
MDVGREGARRGGRSRRELIRAAAALGALAPVAACAAPAAAAPRTLSAGGPEGVDVREFGTVDTADESFDAYPVFRTAVDQMPEGATLWVPPVPPGQAYRLSAELDVDRHVNIAGSWGRDKNDDNLDEVYGSVLRPIDGDAQQAMTSLVRVRRSWVQLEGIALRGHGASEGSIGLRFSGDGPGRHSHGATARRVVGVEFGAGACFGDWSDHATLDSCALNGNTDGVVFERDNHFDHFVTNSFLDGNARSSVFLPDGVGTDNFAVVRSHLGFSEYGILQEGPGVEERGFSGLVLLASPIEFVSRQHVALGTSGNIRVEGGYWTWDGTPDFPAFSIRNVTHGPIWLAPRLDPGFANPNSPALVEVEGYTNHPVHVLTPLNDFARTVHAGPTGRPVVQGSWARGEVLGSLVAALGEAGLIEDRTTP